MNFSRGAINKFSGMKFSIFFVCVLSLSLEVICQSNGEEAAFSLIFDTPGNITITGVFEGLPGKGCRLKSIKALEEMASAIWVVEALNKYKFLSGITIGLSVFEICRVNHDKQLDVLHALSRDSETNSKTYKMGVLTTLDLKGDEETIENGSGFISQVSHVANEEILPDLAVRLLSNLEWMTVDAILADSEAILDYFVEKASTEGISVFDRFLVNESWRFQLLRNSTAENESKVVVAIAGSDQIIKLAEVSEMAKEKNLKLILAPRDSIFLPSRELPEETIVILPSIGDRNILTQFVLGKHGHNHREPTKSPLFLGVAATILKFLQPFKKIQQESCEKNAEPEIPCKKLVCFIDFLKENGTVLPEWKNLEITPGDVENVLKVLKLEPNSNGELFMYIASILKQHQQQQRRQEPNFLSEEAAIFQIFDLKKKMFSPILLKINDELFDESTGIVVDEERERMVMIDPDRFPREKDKSISIEPSKSIDSSKMNLNGHRDSSTTQQVPFDLKNESPHQRPEGSNCTKNESATTGNHFPKWRTPTWVTVNASLGSIGLLCTIFCIVLFVSGSACKSDTLEGSPAFIVSLALSVCLTFLSSFPYHLEPSPSDRFTLQLICDSRIHAPPLAYAILFSLMLSRCLMLASSDYGNGFVSHVNGYFQTILFLCLSGVQISMTGQNWFRHRVTVHESDCPEVNESHKFLVSLVYEFILLAFLLCTIPFVFRLKRNHREGLQLGLASFFVAIVWSIWATFYSFLPPEDLDAVVAIGLNSTAATILIFAFASRVYLMASAMVRNRTSDSLRTFDRNVLPEISDLNYKSNGNGSDSLRESDICEAFNIGVSNPNFVQ